MEIQVAGDGTGLPGLSVCLHSTAAPRRVSSPREGALLSDYVMSIVSLTLFSIPH